MFSRALSLARRGRALQRCFSQSSPGRGLRVLVTELSDDPVRGIEQLRLEEMAEPDLSSLPEESVVVSVSHCAVHWVDCLMVAGQYQQAPPLPYTPGMEYSGTVEAVTGSGTGVEPGDQVYISGLYRCNNLCTGVHLGSVRRSQELRTLSEVRRVRLLHSGSEHRGGEDPCRSLHGRGRHTQWGV